MMNPFKQLAPLALAVAAMSSAHADVSLLDSSMFASIVAGGSGATVGAVTFSSAPGAFATKNVFGWVGLGVSGATDGEIDIGETVTMSWASGLRIKNISVAALFNGPEYGDYAEIAQVKAYNGATLVATGQLQVDGVNDTLATFSGTGFGTVGNLSPADGSSGGAWSISNPFGSASVTRLEFTALASSLCGARSCSNQSDYMLSGVSAVPEPETWALMLAGLGAVAAIARRRRTPA